MSSRALDSLGREARSVKLQVYTTPTIERRIREIAEKNHRSVSDWITIQLAGVVDGELVRVDFVGD